MNTKLAMTLAGMFAIIYGCALSPNGATPVRYTSVTTFAGSVTAGTRDGAGSAALLNRPHGMAIGADGTVYVSDRGNHQIRAIDPSGNVRTLAGSKQGFADGSGRVALFFDPIAIAADSSGILYVADRNNHRIRKITRDGTVTTLAGTGAAGFNNGPANTATFNQPYGVALDGAQRILYVADYLNHAIRKLDLSTGFVSTIAGNGTAGNADGMGSAARFNQPYNVKMDGAGNLWVPDQSNHSIRKVTSNGNVTTIAGNGKEGYADGRGTNAQFNNPTGLISTTDGAVIVADRNNHRIRRVESDGTVTTLTGDGKGAFSDGPIAGAQFNRPIDIVMGSDGRLFVSEENNHRVRAINP